TAPCRPPAPVPPVLPWRQTSTRRGLGRLRALGSRGRGNDAGGGGEAGGGDGGRATPAYAHHRVSHPPPSSRHTDEIHGSVPAACTGPTRPAVAPDRQASWSRQAPRTGFPPSRE